MKGNPYPALMITSVFYVVFLVEYHMSVCDFSAGGQRADSESGGKTSTVDSGMTIPIAHVQKPFILYDKMISDQCACQADPGSAFTALISYGLYCV